MPLYLTEADVAAAADPGGRRRGRRGELPPARARAPSTTCRALGCPLPDGVFAVMACVDRELGYAGLKSYAWLPGGTPFLVVLFSVEQARVEAVIEADKLGQLRTGAASAVAARHLAKQGAATLGVIGTRLAGRVAGRLHPRGHAFALARRRLRPRSGPARRVLQGERLRGRGVPPRGRPSRTSSSP